MNKGRVFGEAHKGRSGIKVPVNDTTPFIFDYDTLSYLEDFLSNESSKDSITAYIMQESIRKHS